MGDVILVLLLLLVIGGGWLFKNTDPKTLAKLLRYGLVATLVVLAIGLALSGRGIFDLPIGAVIFWLLRNWLASNFLGLGRLNAWLQGKRYEQTKPGAEQPGARRGPGAGRSNSGPDPRSGMSKAEAFQILGIEPGATADQIREAHRELMLKIHPDRGGSTYLARQVNAARDVLLAE